MDYDNWTSGAKQLEIDARFVAIWASTLLAPVTALLVYDDYFATDRQKVYLWHQRP